MKLECIGVAFTTKSDSIEIATYSDFEDQLS